MSKETTYAGMVGSWQRWIAALMANGGDLAHLQVPWEQLESLRLQGQDLIQRQSELAAAKQEYSQQLRRVMGEGQRLVTVLKLSVKHHYGIDSEKLAEFGVQPFRGRPRRKVDEPPPEVETPQAV
ncbi:MAG TPA: hypothetical protein VNW71_14570 [Thermoanaerobaculia bacterium]|nr:hypothetical protein [Thermoanaerobaculia bacterium]